MQAQRRTTAVKREHNFRLTAVRQRNQPVRGLVREDTLRRAVDGERPEFRAGRRLEPQPRPRARGHRQAQHSQHIAVLLEGCRAIQHVEHGLRGGHRLETAHLYTQRCLRGHATEAALAGRLRAQRGFKPVQGHLRHQPLRFHAERAIVRLIHHEAPGTAGVLEHHRQPHLD